MPVWQLRLLRGRPGNPLRLQTYRVELPADAYLIDAVEKIWAEQDRDLLFRHACHHASCGACGVRVNGRERLMCITPLREFAPDRPITVEPLRHFPWLGDLLVDVSPMMQRIAAVGFGVIRQDELKADLPLPEGVEKATRFEDCIECGLCVSACPVMAADEAYLGPATLAAIERVLAEPQGADRGRLLALADDPHGVWRCHSAMECTEVCPSNVNPAAAIGRLRRYLLAEKLRRWLGGGR
jgi:succinate dehydrogenase / fumarate reductase iron-sulfur subunit